HGRTVAKEGPAASEIPSVGAPRRLRDVRRARLAPPGSPDHRGPDGALHRHLLPSLEGLPALPRGPERPLRRPSNGREGRVHSDAGEDGNGATGAPAGG